MATMYEMIMDLPLFKGVGKDHISLFLEKTHIGFQNYKPGEVLAEVGEAVKMLRFVISGQVKLIHYLCGSQLTIEEISDCGNVLGADRLFGLTTGYPYKIVAETDVSIMEFTKEQYMSLLHTDRIYMFNFFNYLSLRAQRPSDYLSSFPQNHVGSRLELAVGILTEPSALKVTLKGSDDTFSRYCSVSVDEFRKWKEEISRKENVKCIGDSIVIKGNRV